MDNQWPDLWWEPESLRLLRRRVQKPRIGEDLWAWAVLRRFSLYISIYLQRTSVTPNMVTVLSLLVAAVSGLWMTFRPTSMLTAFLMFNLVYLLDCIDGELARLTETFSPLGKYLDKMLHLGFIIMLCGLLTTLLSNLPRAFASFAVAFVATNHLTSFWLTVGASMSLNRSLACINPEKRQQSPVLDWLILIFANPLGLYLGLAIISLTSGGSSVPSILWFALHEGGEVLKNAWRIHLLAASATGSTTTEC